jgi:two-component system sensor histidine kinase DegS
MNVHLALDTQSLHKERLRPEVEIVLFRVMQEAVNNVAQHANACNVQIKLETSDGMMVAHIEDDGQGFDPTKPRARWGLVGMRERANLIGGQVDVNSAPGRGTQIDIRIPLVEKRP